MSICVCTYMHMSVCVSVWGVMCVSACVYLCVYICVYVSVCVCEYVYVICVPVCVCAHVLTYAGTLAGGQGGRKRMSSPPELKLQVVVINPACLLGTELKSSGRAAVLVTPGCLS